MTASLKDFRVRVFSAADWASYYRLEEKLNPQVEDILQSSCSFYSKKRVFETHFAFVGMPTINGNPLTVAKYLELHPTDGQPKFHFNSNDNRWLWHKGQPHTDIATLEPRLYLLLREVVPGSVGKPLEGQVAMLPPEYEVPSTIAEVTKDILVYRRTGKRSNPLRWAACSEHTVKTERVDAGGVSCVGHFGESGLFVCCCNDNGDVDVGVGASRILNLESLKA